VIDAIYREEWGHLVAYLAGLFGDVDVAEEAAQDAFVVAAGRWPRDGLPDNPRAWLRTTARNKAIDRLRRDKRLTVGVDERRVEAAVARNPDEPAVPDERLELIFACCHPAISPEAQVALVLRSLVGMSTADIARGFLVSEETMKRRLTRAKVKLRSTGIPFARPRAEHLAERLGAVLKVVYLVYNAGYGGRADLAAQAIWLGRVLASLLPDESEVNGLLALMLLHESRHDARVVDGVFIPLPDQDRSLWDRELIDEGCDRLVRALAGSDRSAYLLQAQIAAEHCQDFINWHRIVDLYTELQKVEDSDVIRLNKAIAVAECGSPQSGLAMLEGIHLPGYHYLHASRGELLDRLGRTADARAEFARACELAQSEPDRAFLRERLGRLTQTTIRASNEEERERP
jgi:RNA polymerase sigma-70 factor (ECF subfamily)